MNLISFQKPKMNLDFETNLKSSILNNVYRSASIHFHGFTESVGFREPPSKYNFRKRLDNLYKH